MVYPSAYRISTICCHACSDGSGNPNAFSNTRSDGSGDSNTFSNTRSDGSAKSYSYSDTRVDRSVRGALALADCPPSCGSAGGLGPGPAAQESPMMRKMPPANNPALPIAGPVARAVNAMARECPARPTIEW